MVNTIWLLLLYSHTGLEYIYHMYAIITHYWVENTLNYKLWILRLRKISCNAYLFKKFTYKTDIIKVVLVFLTSNFFINKNFQRRKMCSWKKYLLARIRLYHAAYTVYNPENKFYQKFDSFASPGNFYCSYLLITSYSRNFLCV